MDKKGILSNWVVRNLLLALGLVLALLLAAIISLRVGTRHGKEIIVPDFTNMKVQEASALAARSKVRVEVADSVFVRRMAKGAVYRQDPAAGSRVKEGRRILLVVNAMNSKKVTMPNVVGCSMRQAKAEIVSRGLRVGKLIYVSDMATNNVLKQQVRGTDVRPGTQLESETRVDLVLGLDPEDNMTIVPHVIGLKTLAAEDVVHDYSLNIRRMVYDGSVQSYSDTLDAVVFRQTPEHSSGAARIGGEMTLYLTVDPDKMPSR